MAKTKVNIPSIDNNIRRIVHEELASLFHASAQSFIEDETEYVIPTMLSSAPRKMRHKRGGGKGRVTNPNDKRLKENRANA